ncbi:MAG: nucleotidyltransferase domain-containing protein [Candidatus Bathyarchaeia archaeon]
MLDRLEIRDKRYLEDLEEYLKALLKDKNVVAILLYGSLSKGLAKFYPESDIDLLIVAKELPKNLIERRFKALKLKKKRPMAIEDIWLTPKELIDGIEGGWGIILDALADGITIYDPENILKTTRETVKKKYKRIGRVWIL